MEYRRFGTTDYEVSPMGLGCLSMSGMYGAGDDDESIATCTGFRAWHQLPGHLRQLRQRHNHVLIGKAIKGRRDQVVIHSKSGSPRAADGTGLDGGSSPEYLVQTCEESLQRLGIDCLDIYCMSRIDPAIPVEESVGGMARLVEQGKARYIGLSEASADSIRRAQKVHPIVSLQIEYSLWSRDPEQGNIDACREFNMGLMAYSPLGRGFFAGTVRSLNQLGERDGRRNQPRLQPGNIEK